LFYSNFLAFPSLYLLFVHKMSQESHTTAGSEWLEDETAETLLDTQAQEDANFLHKTLHQIMAYDNGCDVFADTNSDRNNFSGCSLASESSEDLLRYNKKRKRHLEMVNTERSIHRSYFTTSLPQQQQSIANDDSSNESVPPWLTCAVHPSPEAIKILSCPKY